MVRIKGLLVLALVAAITGAGGWAAEADGLSGSVGMEAALLPSFATDLWLDLDWNADGFSISSRTDISVLPGFTVSETLTAGLSFGLFDLRTTMGINVYPFGFGVFSVYSGVGLLDIAQDGFSFSVDASLHSEIYPTFGNTLSLDVVAAYGIFSLWADFDLGIPGFGVGVLVSGEIRVLDLDLANGQLTADLGASATFVPAAEGRLWFDMVLSLGEIVVRSDTSFTLAPFGLTEQRFEIEFGFGVLSVYAWGSFTGAGDLSAGIGGTYDFP